MTRRHTQRIAPRETSVSPIEANSHRDSKSFKDNIDHLEALEYAARLRLAIAYLQNGKTAVQSSKSGETSSQREKNKRVLKNPDLIFDLLGSPRNGLGERKKCVSEEPDFSLLDLSSDKMTLGELESLLEVVETETEQRVQNSLKKGIELHFETFCESQGLDKIEHIILALLIANNTSKGFRSLYGQCELDPEDRQDGGMSIGAILSIVHHEYRDQVASRKYFSIDAPLIKHEIIIPWHRYDNTTNILDMLVHIHERIVSYILGDNNIYDTDLRCISREKSRVLLDQVILPGDLKEEAVNLARNYLTNRSGQERILIEEFYGYGTGLTFLFHGPSGTGKTMLAHALANSLNKELLSIDFFKANQLGSSTEDLIKYVFREAKLCSGIVFFDECDDVFHRDSDTNRTLLIEIEKTECITILATNRVIELHPALDRRITMKVPFHLPDENQREAIWKALVPPNILLSKDVDLNRLARKYVFSGGLIKNALFMTITNAIGKNGNLKVTITSGEIEQAANYQAASIFELNGFGKLYTPEIAIEQLPIRSQDKKMLRKLAYAYKGLDGQETGMGLVVGSSDIQTGIDCVDAVAKECELKVKEFRLSDVLYESGSPKQIKDPLTQKQIIALDYAFRTSTGHQSLTLFVDQGSIFERFLLKDQEDWEKELSGFLDKLRNFQGKLFLVTTPLKRYQLPIEFNHYMEIHLPPEELQIRRWELYFKSEANIEGKIVELIERYPLHLHQIDFIARQASMTAFLDGHDGTITADYVYEAIKRFKNMRKTPALFGKKL